MWSFFSILILLSLISSVLFQFTLGQGLVRLCLMTLSIMAFLFLLVSCTLLKYLILELIFGDPDNFLGDLCQCLGTTDQVKKKKETPK